MRCGGLPEVANPAYLVRFLCSALHRIALPVVSEWYQEQVDGASPIPLHVSLEGHSLRNGLQKPFRHGKGEGEGLVAPFLAATASSSAQSLPLLCGPWVFWCPWTFLHRTFWWRCVASRSLSHRSLFAIGSLRWLSHRFSRHFLYQPLLMQLMR